MEKRFINGIEVQHGSGNVYADLALPDAENSKLKPAL